MIDMLFWDVNLSSFDNFGRKKNLGSNGLNTYAALTSSDRKYNEIFYILK